MPNYKGRRPGTRRIIIWNNGKSLEWIIEGTKADGDAFEAKKRLELKAQGEARIAPLFSDLCKLYAVHAEQHLKRSTWKLVRVYQVTTLSTHLGKIKVDAFRTEHLDAYKRERLSEKHVDKPVSVAAVNNELRVLSAMFSWSRDAGYPVPALKIKQMKRRKTDRAKIWTMDELERIFEATREKYPEMLPMLVFMANTGCRKGEAIAARWSWVDFERENIEIPATDTWQPKSGRSRDVPLGDAVRAVLSGPRRHKDVLFPVARGTRPYLSFPNEAFREILKSAKVQGNPHMFRHTYASNFLAAVPDIGLLAEVLGHSTTRVTELYSHMLPGRLERAKNAVSILPTMAVTMAKKKKTSKTA